jgi:hypothetical protein
MSVAECLHFGATTIRTSIAIRIDKPSALRPVGIRSVYNLSHEFGLCSIELADHILSDIQVLTMYFIWAAGSCSGDHGRTNRPLHCR